MSQYVRLRHRHRRTAGQTRNYSRIYADPRWADVRAACLHRDNYRCVRCGTRKELEADHVVGVADGGRPFDMGNVQTLCRRCNQLKGLRDMGVRRRGYSVEVDADGRYVDPRHPSNAR